MSIVFALERQTPETITVQGIIEITQGAYGHNAFKEFFAKNGMAVAA